MSTAVRDGDDTQNLDCHVELTDLFTNHYNYCKGLLILTY